MKTIGRPTNDAIRRKLIARRYQAAVDRHKIAVGQATLRRIQVQMELKRLKQLNLPLGDTAA